MALRLTSFYQSKGRGIASLLFIFAQVRLFRSFVFHTHQGSASGKRSNGCPEPPTKSPPSPYTREPDPRDGGARREPVEDFRFQSAHIRNTPVLSELARMCKFAPSVFSFGPSIAQPLAAVPLTDAAYPLRVRPVFFSARRKENGGCVARPSTWSHAPSHRTAPIETDTAAHSEKEVNPLLWQN